MNVFRNFEGYLDTTAGQAITNVTTEKEQTKLQPGDLVWTKSVSCNKFNIKSLILNDTGKYYVTVMVFDEYKADNNETPLTDVDGKTYYFCESRTCYTYYNHTDNVFSKVDDDELERVKGLLRHGLGVAESELKVKDIVTDDSYVDFVEPDDDAVVQEEIVPAEIVCTEPKPVVAEYDIRIAKLEAERDTYKQLVMELFKKAV